MAERFVTFDITEVEEFIDNEENSNTRRKTKNNMALLSSFMAKEKENRQFEEIQCLWGINPTNTVFYSPEPRAEVYCLQLNFKISKLAYYTMLAKYATTRLQRRR